MLMRVSVRAFGRSYVIVEVLFLVILFICGYERTANERGVAHEQARFGHLRREIGFVQNR